MDRIMVPPVFRMAGRNFSTGMKMNFSLANHFSPRTAMRMTGPKTFFHQGAAPCGCGSVFTGAGGGASGGRTIGGAGGGGRCSMREHIDMNVGAVNLFARTLIAETGGDLRSAAQDTQRFTFRR